MEPRFYNWHDSFHGYLESGNPSVWTPKKLFDFDIILIFKIVSNSEAEAPIMV